MNLTNFSSTLLLNPQHQLYHDVMNKVHDLDKASRDVIHLAKSVNMGWRKELDQVTEDGQFDPEMAAFAKSAGAAYTHIGSEMIICVDGLLKEVLKVKGEIEANFLHTTLEQIVKRECIVEQDSAAVKHQKPPFLQALYYSLWKPHKKNQPIESKVNNENSKSTENANEPAKTKVKSDTDDSLYVANNLHLQKAIDTEKDVSESQQYEGKTEAHISLTEELETKMIPAKSISNIEIQNEKLTDVRDNNNETMHSYPSVILTDASENVAFRHDNCSHKSIGKSSTELIDKCVNLTRQMTQDVSKSTTDAYEGRRPSSGRHRSTSLDNTRLSMHAAKSVDFIKSPLKVESSETNEGKERIEECPKQIDSPNEMDGKVADDNHKDTDKHTTATVQKYVRQVKSDQHEEHNERISTYVTAVHSAPKPRAVPSQKIETPQVKQPQGETTRKGKVTLMPCQRHRHSEIIRKKALELKCQKNMRKKKRVPSSQGSRTVKPKNEAPVRNAVVEQLKQLPSGYQAIHDKNGIVMFPAIQRSFVLVPSYLAKPPVIRPKMNRVVAERRAYIIQMMEKQRKKNKDQRGFHDVL